ncbi:sugar nucleotide-binding protein [Candidatus Woesearchaeota archaeon]|nr:sugar nucleotide-binding protein [Candidatus Woesearchaeota archaeon]
MNNNKKILILGGSSYVGKHLFNSLGKDKAVGTYCNKPFKGGVYFDSLSMDLSQILKDLGPFSHAVILLGDTNPETCAEDIEKSNTLNVESIKSIIECLNNHQIKPVFTSTLFVFDGKKGNYVEEDPVSPILIYGKQKVEIERYIQDKCKAFIIARLSKVFGSQKNDGTLFIDWIESINKNQTIRCAQDQIFSPAYIKDVVDSIIRLIDNDCNGIFHISSKKPYSRLELLEMLLSHIKKYSSVKGNVVKCSIHDFPLREKRPLNVSMKPDKLINAIGIKLHDVNDVCESIAKEYFGIGRDE